MNEPMTVGSMCTGSGMLDVGVASVLDLMPVWHAEPDPAASTVLAAHWPSVPNLGDLRAVDWTAVPPVDVLLAGFPCQPVSAAGRRRGLSDERWLFDDIADAVGRLEPRPRLCLFENVAGLLSANRGQAMARVVHRLAALGYLGRYRLLRASDVGAPHRRERVFIAAWLPDRPNPWPLRTAGRGADAVRGADRDRVRLLPTPAARDGDGRGEGHPDHRRDRARRTGANIGGPMLGEVVCHLLPTPRASDGSRGPEPLNGAGRTGHGTGPALPDVAVLLPTPRATDGCKGGPNQRGSAGDLALPAAVQDGRFGNYGAAIRRWEQITGRAAPEPTEPGRTGNPRLAARFAEWVMGWPDGWVTDHIARNDALRVCGNGVVPQQAAAGYAELLQPEPAATPHDQRRAA
ncbi:DNA cytosine methyltransferase [Micromonospora sp. CPCC 206061]|uniref:DNA cytosine methyltransferase n=1 Tax=Micromonospora sp. CPCC 206061 TaxID=3122410 RepID=UPI002FF1B2C1